eukprot:PhF_6_TR23794/c1_g2_i1/m.33298/K00809/DHPS, dys; deoxyhypusine synthase
MSGSDSVAEVVVNPEEDVSAAAAAVFVPSTDLAAEGATKIKGVISQDLQEVFASYKTTGFQASNLALGMSIIEEMLLWRHDPTVRDHKDKEALTITTIFFAFPCHLAMTIVRDVAAFLAKHKLLHKIIVSGGTIEADIGRCLGDTETTFLPKFREWFTKNVIPTLDPSGTYSPSDLARIMGHAVNDENSFAYWAAKNNIPIFIPSFADGTCAEVLVDALPNVKVDLVKDIRDLNKSAMDARKTGMIIVGGGVVKHHTCNANLMRNGADYAVYINTAEEFDGSDGGARPDEAVSWGKIRGEGKHVKVHADATVVLPMMLAQCCVPYLKGSH